MEGIRGELTGIDECETIKVEIKFEMYDRPNGILVGWDKLYINDKLISVRGIYDDKTIECELDMIADFSEFIND